VLDRAILGDVSDPRFNLVRDPVFTKLQHLHKVVLNSNHTEDHPDEDGDLVVDQDAPLHYQPRDDSSPPVTSRVAEFGSMVKSLLTRMVSSLDIQPAPSSSSAVAGSPALSFNFVVNQTAVVPTGLGTGPLPTTTIPAGARVPEFGPVDPSVFPWSTVYAGGDACAGPLPDAAPRDHQVLVLRRGGCSFSAKLANIPAHAPSPRSLQLVVVVSGEEDDGADYKSYALSAAAPGLIRPLLEEVQRTPGGLERRHPIPMVMVAGGDVAYHQLAVAERVGLARRYYLESQGTRVRNIIVDEGDAGVNP